MLFTKKIDPSCAYCQRGKPITSEKVLCPKKGVVTAEASCASFRYDPLKRVPFRQPALTRHEEEEFRI